MPIQTEQNRVGWRRENGITKIVDAVATKDVHFICWAAQSSSESPDAICKIDIAEYEADK